MKFSECINEFSTIWQEWAKCNDIAVDKTESNKARREAAVKAEKILNRRYYLTNKINEYFDAFDEDFE